MKNVSDRLNTNSKKANSKGSDRSARAVDVGSKKKRACLKCGQKFHSKGPFNRICDKCSMSNERVAASAYSVGNRPTAGSAPFEKQLYELN